MPPRCLIGRSSACQIRVTTPETSHEHALMRWRNGVWELQDLHSRNGTYVDGRRLGAGKMIGVPAGATLGFGRREQFTLLDDGAPQPHAVSTRPPYSVVEARDGFLCLPDFDAVEVTVLYRQQRWWLERAEESLPITDGERVRTRAGSWIVHLPDPLAATRDAEDAAPNLTGLLLRFHVGADGSVELLALRGDQRIEFDVRAHHLPLLALARERLGARGAASDEEGWVEQDALIRKLGCDSNRLHVEIHRLRRQFAAAGIVDAMNIVERREGTRQLRIGVRRIEIVSSGSTVPSGSARPAS